MAGDSLITSLMRPFFKKGESTSFTLPRALSDARRMLCIDTGELTDFLFHMPLINAIRHGYPGCQLDFLIPEKHEPLVTQSGMTKRCIVYRDGQLSPWRPAYGSLLKDLGARQYDAAMLMSLEARPRLELAALASGAGLRLGPSHSKSWPSINFEMRPPADPQLYLGDRMAAAAPFLGLRPDQLNSRWPLPMDRLRHVAQQVHFHKPNPDQMLIGMDPGVGKSGHAIAQDNLLYVARHMTQQLMCRVVPLGQPGDKDRLTRFETRLSDIPVGLTRDDVLDMVLLLAQCDLFISGNTDFFHFAVAMGIPAIGLFTASDPACWIPDGRKKVKVLTFKKGAKVDLEVLLEAIEDVTEGRTRTTTTILPPEQAAALEKTTNIRPSPGVADSGDSKSADHPAHE